MKLSQDPMFYYTISFAVFVVLAYIYGRKPMLAWLDGEIQKVRDRLKEAEKMRAEAEAELAQYQKRQAEALAHAEALIRHAKEEADRLKAKAEADLKSAMARQEQMATERIRLAEAAAIEAVRQKAIDVAVDAARKSLRASLQGDAATKLVDQAIADMPQTGDAKAKAA
jgi:F-type H+-transporting ATPase subunit b